MMTPKRSLAKLLGPALLLTATLSVPAVSTATPSPKDNKAHATEKWDKKEHKQDKAKAKNKAQDQREAAKLRAHQQREAAKLRAEREREAVKLRNERERVARQPVYRGDRVNPVHQPAQPVPNRNRRRYDWDGWNRGRGSGFFTLDGALFDQRQGCQLLRDHRGQVIPLVGFPLASHSEILERGDHVELYGRVQTNTACGTAFRVHEVQRVWDARHRDLIFDRRRDGDFESVDRLYGRYDRDRSDRDRYDDRFDDRFDRDGRLISVDGRLGGSSRCPSLRTDDGELFGLQGDLGGYEPGEHVRVIGFFEPSRSSCGHGRTIVFDEIRRS